MLQRGDTGKEWKKRMVITPMVVCSWEIAQAVQAELSLFRQEHFFTKQTEARIKQVQQVILDRRHQNGPLDITS